MRTDEDLIDLKKDLGAGNEQTFNAYRISLKLSDTGILLVPFDIKKEEKKNIHIKRAKTSKLKLKIEILKIEVF